MLEITLDQTCAHSHLKIKECVCVCVCVCVWRGGGGVWRGSICRNSRTTGTNPHQSVPSVTSQHVASSQTGTSVEMYRII